MAKSSKIKVMISSKCKSKFDRKTLSDIRKELKGEIEKIKLNDKEIFEVWINEGELPQGGDKDSWDVCLNKVRECDILLVLSNGDAGWTKENGGIGICHAEFMEGLRHAPGKVHVISLKEIRKSKDLCKQRRNDDFREYLDTQNRFVNGKPVTRCNELLSLVKETVCDVLVKLVKKGVVECSKGKFYSGHAFEWSQLNFEERKNEMKEVVKRFLKQPRLSKECDGNVLVSMEKNKILCVPNAIPAAMSIPAAREMVAQPFLLDYKLAKYLNNNGGPVHVIACLKTVTENQAIKMIGFADATVVNAPFGIFVADKIQKIQIIFINNCRDETTTRYGLQRFFDWLDQENVGVDIVKFAKSRAIIVKAIDKELKK